ncbi:MAG: AgmX/PglI C-terminal domain-containing protein [Myxococcaceae bacterium]|nr:AgmX/PglI C-terminal domain-containing protein [Myxococcaceae bacterium]
MTSLALTVLLLLTADKGQKNDTMKGLIKDAAAGAAAPAPTADGGTEAPARPGPDVTKMPFTPESIKTVVAFYQPQIQGCYEEHLAGKKKAEEGKLMTSFTITGEGTVSKPKVEKKGTTLKDPHLHECVISVLSAMSFPKPADGKGHPIEFPFNLKAVE